MFIVHTVIFDKQSFPYKFVSSALLHSTSQMMLPRAAFADPNLCSSSPISSLPFLVHALSRSSGKPIEVSSPKAIICTIHARTSILGSLDFSCRPKLPALAIHLSANPVFHAQTKHIEVDYHWNLLDALWGCHHARRSYCPGHLPAKKWVGWGNSPPERNVTWDKSTHLSSRHYMLCSMFYVLYAILPASVFQCILVAKTYGSSFRSVPKYTLPKYSDFGNFFS